ncbi:MAG: S-layer homology domain-containing protein [Oscillospiraceae bacterium]|nr:S-layer homology domain-containing protein [Oscillospiraceae bacterium]
MKRFAALLLAACLLTAMFPAAFAAQADMPKQDVDTADVLALTGAPNRYEPMSDKVLDEGCWIVPMFETYGLSAVIGNTMEINMHVCAAGVTDQGIVGMMIYKGVYEQITDDSEPVFTVAEYAIGGHDSYRNVFEWNTKGCSAGDYTALFFIMNEASEILFASAADLYLSKKAIPMTGVEIYVYELDRTPDEIVLLQDGGFSYGVIYEPYHTTATREYMKNSTGDLSYTGSCKSDGAGLLKVERVSGSATLTVTAADDTKDVEEGVAFTDTLNIVIGSADTMASFEKNYVRSCLGSWVELPVSVPEGKECMVYNGSPYLIELKIENNTLYGRGLSMGLGEVSIITGNAIDRIEVGSGDHICKEDWKNATCTEDGWERDVCEYCSEIVRQTVIPAKGHKVQTWETVLEPTATKDGLAVGTCSRCDTEVETVVSRIFTDTQPDWFYSDALDYCYEAGIINGLDGHTFGPTATLNRAQLVTMLYRHAGSPTVEGENTFADVPAESFYTDAVIWASENGIVNGYEDGSFRPADAITREQIVTMLHRYVVSLGMDNGERNDLAAFEDLDMLHGYAREPMEWAVANGVINGLSETALGPQQSANRAQTVTILYRIITGILAE